MIDLTEPSLSDVKFLRVIYGQLTYLSTDGNERSSLKIRRIKLKNIVGG